MTTPRSAAPVTDAEDGDAQLYHLIAEGIPNMVWTARPDGGLDFFNRRVFEYTGLTTAELGQWGWRRVVHPDDIAECEARWRRSVEGGEDYEAEFRIRRGADGAYRWHIGAALPLRGPDGRVAKWFGTCTDIDDQKKASSARSAAALGEAQRLAHIGSWEADQATGAVTWSEEMFRIFGLDPADHAPPPHLHPALYAPDSWALLECTALRSLATGEPYELELKVIRPGGEALWTLSRGEVVLDSAGNKSLRGTVQDIDERRRAQEELQGQSDRIRQLLYRLVDAQEAERRSLASTLHDLIGQKLTALNMGLDILKRDLNPAAGGLVKSRLEALSGLVYETVDAIRGVMSDLRPAELEDFGLVPALHSHARRFELQTGIATAVQADEPYVRLEGNVELALFRVAQEALTNALKHSGASSVRIRAWLEGRRARLAIEDNGRGFSDPEGARSVWRGGWGLPEMRKRAEAVGGTLEIEFPAHGGTRVLVDAPVNDAD